MEERSKKKEYQEKERETPAGAFPAKKVMEVKRILKLGGILKFFTSGLDENI